MRSILALVVGILLATAGSIHAASCGLPADRLDFLIVRLVPGQTVDEAIAALEANNDGLFATPSEQITGRPIHLLELKLPPGWGDVELDQFEASLATDYVGVLLWGEFLYDDETPEGTTGSTFVDGLFGGAHYQGQYPASILGLTNAHGVSNGTGTVVAVVDTGVDVTHPELENNIAPGGFDFVDGDNDPDDEADGADNDNDTLTDEMAGHGTYVAGLVHLAAPGAKILPVRVVDSDGNGDLWQLAQGIFHAVDRGVEVINVSISSTYKSDAVEAAIDEALSLGIVVVAAAGNCNLDDPEEHPAQTSGVLGVVATDDGDVKAGFSNFGPDLFMSAPGASAFDGKDPDATRSVFSTIPGGGYAVWEGTSMASPLVAGAAALVRAQHPQWTATEATADAVASALSATAIDIDGFNPQFAGQLGAGRLDVAAAVQLAPPAPALGDLDGNGAVDVGDLLLLLSQWGLVHASADLNGDGLVNVQDLLVLLSAWG